MNQKIPNLWHVALYTLLVATLCFAGSASRQPTATTHAWRRSAAAQAQAQAQAQGEIVSELNFSMTVLAGQATALSPRLLRFRPSAPGQPPSATDVWFHVTRAPAPSLARLALASRPAQPLARFSQADVEAQRVLLLVAEEEAADAGERQLQMELRATLGPAPEGLELAPPRALRIRVRAPAAAPPAFRRRHPQLRLEQMSEIEFGKEYFEIDGVDDDDPNLMFVITRAPESGSLLFIQNRKLSVSLHEGHEFFLRDFHNGSLKYRHGGNRSKKKDSFEILATDGNFELINNFTINISQKQSKNEGKINVHSRSSVQFVSDLKSIRVLEDASVVRVPVLRKGDLNQEESVRCFTSVEVEDHPPASAGQDFEPRPRDADASVLVFMPGVDLLYCEVLILNDTVYENEEVFSLHLETERENDPSLQNSTKIKVKISDPEDKPMVQFSQEYLTIPDVDQKFLHDSVVPVLINVQRTGDTSSECHVQIITQDGTAVKEIDYKELATPLHFESGVTSLTENVLVLHGRRHGQQQREQRSFYVFIDPRETSGAVLGPRSTLTITIMPTAPEGREFKLFPAKPVVYSLFHYANGSNDSQNAIPPGYPLVCVHACDKTHPLFNVTNTLCELSGFIDSNDSCYYSWEIAPPCKGSIVFTHQPFEELLEPSIFANVHGKVLDPSFFGEGYKVRCSVTPSFKSYDHSGPPLGEAVKSDIVLIGGMDVASLRMCPGPSAILPTGRDSDSEPVFTTSMQYVNKSAMDPKQKNKIHIRVEIPHRDGMLPVISTTPLSNINSFLVFKNYKSYEICSNLPPNGIFLNSFSEKNINENVWSQLEGDTRLLYRHLNTSSCKWIFEGWFYFSELVDTCRGKIASQHQDARSDQNWVSLQVPLHIALHHADGPAEFHQTRLLVTFSYTPTLGHSLEQEYRLSEADIQVTRVQADAEGRLVLDFRTDARFPGVFVLRHEALPHARAQLLAPAAVPSPFDLRALDRAPAPARAHRGRQHWRARSALSLQDYSGEYTAVLVPCWARARAPGAECEPRTPVRLPLRVRFRRGHAPAPLHLALDTRLLLGRAPPAAPADAQDDYTGAWARGERVFGRVLLLLQPEQRLHETYAVRVRRVMLCATPRAAPPPAQCTPAPAAAAPAPSHLLVILQLSKSPVGFGYYCSVVRRFDTQDRENSDIIDDSFHDVNFKASFSSNTALLQHFDSYAYIDGFSFQVAPLYAPKAEYLQWYLQVVYSISPTSRRIRRSIDNKTSASENGTSIRTLRLHWKNKSIHITEHVLGLTLGPAMVLLFIPLLATSVILRIKRMCTQNLN